MCDNPGSFIDRSIISFTNVYTCQYICCWRLGFLIPIENQGEFYSLTIRAGNATFERRKKRIAVFISRWVPRLEGGRRFHYFTASRHNKQKRHKKHHFLDKLNYL